MEEVVVYASECDVCKKHMDTPFMFVRTEGGTWDAVCKMCSLSVMRMALMAGKITEELGGGIEIVGFAPLRIENEGPVRPKRRR